MRTCWATFQAYLQRRLIENLAKRAGGVGGRAPNLCMAGGCALNVVWNGAIRKSGIFNEVFVPPFPNDAGSALGQACAMQVVRGGMLALNWSVYAGPELIPGDVPVGWRAKSCTPVDLARLIHEVGEPVVVLHGRAEIGPRALGNRSILARADSAAMKDRLNLIKQREPYRPVAPICVEEAAPQYFDPGTPDPFMVFNHDVRPEWRERLAAIMHVDGSARLQTVSAEQNPVIHAVLSAGWRAWRRPRFCATLAPITSDAASFPTSRPPLPGNGVRFVWSDGTLYEKRSRRGGGRLMDIAVIGIACRLPGAGDFTAYRRLLREGRVAIGQIAPQRIASCGLPADARYMTAGYLDDIDLFDAGPPSEWRTTMRRRLDPQQRLGLEIAVEAIEDAGYPGMSAGRRGPASSVASSRACI